MSSVGHYATGLPRPVGSEYRQRKVYAAEAWGPVQVECLDYALDELSGNEYGIYAGTTNRERRRLIRQRRAA